MEMNPGLLVYRTRATIPAGGCPISDVITEKPYAHANSIIKASPRSVHSTRVLSSSFSSQRPESLPLNLNFQLIFTGQTQSRTMAFLDNRVWSWLATVFACTWVAVHPNLPGPRDAPWIMFKRHG
jgi:hypothetical protein